MRNGASLVLAGGLLAALGWSFWHYLGDDAFAALSAITLLVLLVDNARLRRRLRASQGDRQSS